MENRRKFEEVDTTEEIVLHTAIYLFLSLFALAGLIAMLVVTSKIEDGRFLGSLTPYKTYVLLAEIIVFGILATEFGGRWIRDLLLVHIATDAASTVRIVFRVVAYGVLISAAVSIVTENGTAAVSAGAFAGMVAGMAAQSVLGNVVAGVFLAIMRPVGIGDNVTIGANSGKVVTISPMHTVLQTEDKDIMIPSSSIVNSVLVRHRKQKDNANT